MPQVVEFPPLGNDQRGALAALVRVAKETPPTGEPFKQLRSRLRSAKLWNRDQPATILRFLGVGGATITPSEFMLALAAATSDEDQSIAVLDRLWFLNPVLGKTIVELVQQRAYHKDEIYKHLNSAAYDYKLMSRPGLEIWIQIALACGLLRPLGVAVATGPRFERYAQLAGAFDLEDYVTEDAPQPEPVIPIVAEDDAVAPAAPAEVIVGDTSVPVTASAAPSGSSLPAPLRHLNAEGVPTPRNRERPVPLSRFASAFASVFGDDVLAETTTRIGAWWAELDLVPSTYQPSDFGLDAEQWVEGADEVLYRIAVAAALAFRLDRDRAGVIASYTALDKANVLADLYQGTVPETLPAQVDARALMLASLAARRCAEVPELAASLDGRKSAADVFAALDAALGRGLFKTELFWILDMLARLGVIRYDDLGDFTTTPHRIVRDTLFRLGFIATPYATDATALIGPARAARKAVPTDPSDEILTLFTLAAGCAYDCTHRKSCDFPCRERLE